ncbi:hypothetical protein Tco_0383602 [Tanacetum coccineum]
MGTVLTVYNGLYFSHYFMRSGVASDTGSLDRLSSIQVSLSEEELAWFCLTGVVVVGFLGVARCVAADSGMSMDVVITCQVIDSHFGKPSIRDEERSYFLLWVLQTGFVACFESFCQALVEQGIDLPSKVDSRNIVLRPVKFLGRSWYYSGCPLISERWVLFESFEVERGTFCSANVFCKRAFNKWTNIAEKQS